MRPCVCRKAKMIFGLKVKKKKKKVNTDLVLANKGALGKAWNTHTRTRTHARLMFRTVTLAEPLSNSPVVLCSAAVPQLEPWWVHTGTARVPGCCP